MNDEVSKEDVALRFGEPEVTPVKEIKVEVNKDGSQTGSVQEIR